MTDKRFHIKLPNEVVKVKCLFSTTEIKVRKIIIYHWVVEERERKSGKKRRKKRRERRRKKLIATI